MKVYDFEKVKQIIDGKIAVLESASVGLYEDWFWTGCTVYENHEWKKEFKQGDEVNGIEGSTWATPVVRLFYLDGSDECIPCYTGEANQYQPPRHFELGCLSNPCQNAMPPIKFT